jgi:DNA-binding LacI/PurR family transcriptional regulator
MTPSSREKNVTQSDIAKALGVSQASVGLVLGRNSNGRGKTKLRPETVQRIEEKALEMGYRPHRFAQALRQGRTMTVGMIHAGSLLQVSNERAFFSTQILKQAGYQILSMDINHQASVQEIVQQFLDTRVDGVLLASTMVENHIAPLLDNRIPVVGLSSDDIPGIPQVRCDMGDGIRKLVDHLVEKGFKRLVHVVLTSEHRLPLKNQRWQASNQAEGFSNGIEAACGECHETNLDGYSHWLSRSRESSCVSGLALVCGQLQRRPFNPYLPASELARLLLAADTDHPDAILCQNDDLAFGLGNGFLKAGVNLPRDLAITGFNDSALAETFFIPLTTVRQPTREMADLAVRLLLDAMNGSPAEPLVHKLKGEPVFRESTLMASPGSRPSPGLILN